MTAPPDPAWSSPLKRPSPMLPTRNTTMMLSGTNGAEAGSFLASSDYAFLPRRPFPFHRSLTAPHSQASNKLGALRHPFPGDVPPPGAAAAAVVPARVSQSPQSTATPIDQNRNDEAGPSTGRHTDREREDSAWAALDSTALDSTALDSSLFPSLLADTLQLPISTLLQVIPPHLLDPSHERLSAMSLQVPVTSIEALLEACRTLNWLFARVAEGGSPVGGGFPPRGKARRSTSQPLEGSKGGGEDRSTSAFAAVQRAGGVSMRRSDSSASARAGLAPRPSTAQYVDFDVFELTQRVADMAAGQAAERHIDLVLVQSNDVGNRKRRPQHQQQQQQKHQQGTRTSISATGCSVKGDEGATRFAMVQLVSRSLEKAGLQAVVELDVQVTETDGGSPRCAFSVTILHDQPIDMPEEWTAPLEDVADAAGASVERSLFTGGDEDAPRHGLRQTLIFDFQPGGRLAEAGDLHPRESEARQRFLPSLRLAEEPSAKELVDFVDQDLQGRKVAIHGRPTSDFVKHLTAFLHRCGCQTASLSAVEASPSAPIGATWTNSSSRSMRTAVALSGNRPSLVSYPSGLGMGHEVDNKTSNSVTAVLDPVTGVPLTLQMGQRKSKARTSQSDPSASSDSFSDNDRLTPFSFIIIDDDPDILHRELLRIRSGIATLRSAMGTPVTSRVASSSPPRKRSVGEEIEERRRDSLFDSTQAILYFSSLSNFRVVRDTIQPIVESASQSNTPLPEIIVVPKPAGTRRILTAMHTAIHKPLVDPFFSPIATSPLSPAAAAAMQGVGLSAGDDASSPSSVAPSPSMQERAGFPVASKSNLPGLLRKQEKKEPEHTDKGSPLHIDLPPQPEFSEKRQKEPPSKEVEAAETGEIRTSGPSALDVRNEDKGEGLLLPATTEGAKTVKAGSASRPSTSPMPTDALEYFSETAARMGSSGAVGMMIQSPDGRPAGIFFQPKTSSHGSRTPSSVHKGSDEQGARTSAGGGRLGADAGPRAETGAAMGSATELGPRRRSIQGKRTAAAPPQTADGPSVMASPRSNESLELQEYPSGSMFEPQIELESVLHGNRPPVATPLHNSLSTASSKEDDYLSPQISIHQRLTAAATQVRDQTPKTAKPKSDGGKKSTKPAQPGGKAKVPVENGKGKQKVATSISPAQPAATVPSPIGAPDAALHATRQTFANTNLHAPVRPSAQPQSGLLIGAGFTPTQKRSTGPKKAAKQIKVLPPIKVLIVEDNPINIKILSTFFDRKKIQYDVARDGREAVDRWREGGFHLILMDIQLPVMDGIEATKEIRRYERNANIGVLTSTTPISTINNDQHGKLEIAPSSPSAALVEGPSSTSLATTPSGGLTSRASVIIVALTASVLNSDRVAALAAGCNDFLNKPVDLRWLERKVIEWGSMQYLIGFKAGIAGDDIIAATSTAAGPVSRNGAALTLANNNGEVRKAFADGPDSKARELAGKLHIGGLKKDAKRSKASPTSPA